MDFSSAKYLMIDFKSPRLSLDIMQSSVFSDFILESLVPKTRVLASDENIFSLPVR